MSTDSQIEWTEKTWNPTTGCEKVSPGCKHCYAESLSKRLNAMGASGYENGFKLSLMPNRLRQPLKRRIPTTYFVNSMSDLFWEQIPDYYLDQVFEVITATPHHTYQILTKRANRMVEYFSNKEVPQNAWLGVSVEDRKYGLPRIDQLRKVNAAIRFLSVEPLLEDIGELDLTQIHWVILGGESGPKARPMKEEWALSVRDQCLNSGAKFFFKQWGGWGADGIKRHKKVNGRILGGELFDNYPIVASA